MFIYKTSPFNDLTSVMFRLRFRTTLDFRYTLDVNNYSHRFHSAFKDVNTNVMDFRSLEGHVL